MIVGGTIAQRLGNVILLPFVVATMSSSEFTRFGLFTSTIAIAVPILTMNLHLAIGRIYFDHATDEGKASAFITNILAGAIGILVGGGALLLFLQASGVTDPMTEGDLGLQVEILACALLLVAMQGGSILARTRDRNHLYALSSTVSGAGLLLGYVVLQGVLSDNMQALVYAYLAAQFLAAAVTWSLYRYGIKHGKVRMVHLRSGFAYSAGTMIYVVSIWVIGQGGRWVGGVTLPDAMSAGYTLVSYGMVVLGVMVNAYSESHRIPFLEAFASDRVDDALKIMKTIARRNFAIVGVAFAVGAIVVVFKENLLPLGYHMELVWLLPALVYCLAAALLNHSVWLFGGLKETWWLILTSLCGIGAYLSLLILLIDEGVSGLLWSSALTMFVQAFVLRMIAEWRINCWRARLISEENEA
ncbi:hypothetical protein GCM10011505_31560 [Tistrella bauzanensis]|uniref:Polysaccharide biosynthesis protein C-terminal domain-containing protein n=2 Tax=Tistrella bauzanensis TaxID=657419 RepID=A0ABQ1INA9_9PROT|nr:hypothetical protein GCM10011505_31560 [Tistrella bauzanensis]